MNKCNYDFISKVSRQISLLSQFTEDVCDWIACQFALESYYGESALAKSNNNYCAMRNPLVRISTAIHAGESHFHWAQYDCLLTCVVDYLLCVQYHRPISANYDTIDNYSKFISFYCPDEGYIDRINVIYQQFKSFLK